MKIISHQPAETPPVPAHPGPDPYDLSPGMFFENFLLKSIRMHAVNNFPGYILKMSGWIVQKIPARFKSRTLTLRVKGTTSERHTDQWDFCATGSENGPGFYRTYKPQCSAPPLFRGGILRGSALPGRSLIQILRSGSRSIFLLEGEYHRYLDLWDYFCRLQPIPRPPRLRHGTPRYRRRHDHPEPQSKRKTSIRHPVPR